MNEYLIICYLKQQNLKEKRATYLIFQKFLFKQINKCVCVSVFAHWPKHPALIHFTV